MSYNFKPNTQLRISLSTPIESVFVSNYFLCIAWLSRMQIVDSALPVGAIGDFFLLFF